MYAKLRKKVLIVLICFIVGWFWVGTIYQRARKGFEFDVLTTKKSATAGLHSSRTEKIQLKGILYI